jgi:hypothetical protein
MSIRKRKQSKAMTDHTELLNQLVNLVGPFESPSSIHLNNHLQDYPALQGDEELVRNIYEFLANDVAIFALV